MGSLNCLLTVLVQKVSSHPYSPVLSAVQGQIRENGLCFPLQERQNLAILIFVSALAWLLVFCFISAPELQKLGRLLLVFVRPGKSSSLLLEMVAFQKRISWFFGNMKKEVGFKKKRGWGGRMGRIQITVFQLVSQSRKQVQTLLHRFLALEIPTGWAHMSSLAMKRCWTLAELPPQALPRPLARCEGSPTGLGVNEMLLVHMGWLVTPSGARHVEPVFPLAYAKPEGQRISTGREAVIKSLRNLKTS